ncbi:hypothetical protein KC322_g15322, partial [Hortaea werneckii]
MAGSRTPRAFSSFICQSCRQRLLPSASTRAFSTTSMKAADTQSQNNDRALAGLSNLSSNLHRRKGFNNAASTAANPTSYTSILDQDAAT